MSYEEALIQLGDCVQEYARIYSEVQKLQIRMTIAWVLFGIALVMVIRNHLIPDIKKAVANRHAAVKETRMPSNPRKAAVAKTTPTARYTTADLEDILKEMRG